MSDLTELLERVRQATGPDRQLDREIALFAGYAKLERGWRSPEGEDLVTLPYYTDSIAELETRLDWLTRERDEARTALSEIAELTAPPEQPPWQRFADLASVVDQVHARAREALEGNDG